MRLIGRIEAGVSWFTDRNWVWWPVARFRPKETQRFSKRLVVGLSLPVAIAVTVYSFAITIQEVGWSYETPVIWLLTALVFASVVFVIWGSLVRLAAYCWNRRAARLTGNPMESERVLSARARDLQPVAVASSDLTYLVVASLVIYSMVAFEGTGGSPDAGQGVGLFLLFPATIAAGLMFVWRSAVWKVAGLRLKGSTAYKAAFVGIMISLDALLLAEPLLSLTPDSGYWPAVSPLWIVVLSGIVVLIHTVIAAITRHPETGPIGLRKGAMVSLAYSGVVAAAVAVGWALLGMH